MSSEARQAEGTIRVEVAYALPERQTLLAVTLPAGSTAGEAIEASGVCERHPEIDLAQQSVGVFGQVTGLDTALGDGDRVEIYRPLKVDPKQARRNRASGQGRGKGCGQGRGQEGCGAGGRGRATPRSSGS